MKITYRILILFSWLFAYQLFAQSQMNFWVLPPNRVDLTAATPTSASLPGSPSPSPYVVSNGIYDPSNTLLFYVQDNTIYNGSGTSVGTLSDYVISSSYYYSYIANEIAIVPIPGTCRDYYIIYAKNNAGSTLLGGALLYTSVRVSTSGVVTILSNGNYIDNWVSGNTTSIAVSKLTGSTRKLYCLSQTNVKSFVVSSSGIGSGAVVKSYNATDFVSSNDLNATELDLSSDGTMLTWGVPATDRVYWMTSSGSSVGHLSIPGYTTPSMSSISCNGIEFSPVSNDILFVSMSGYNSSGYQGGIYKVTRSTGATSAINTNGHCNNTHLELGHDGYIYGVDGASTPTAGVLAKVEPISGTTLLSSGLSNVNYSYGSSGFYSGNYRLPDQVDGENYSYFFGVAQLSNSYTLNGSSVSPTSALNTYTCSTISMTPTVSGATGYSIIMREANSTGGIVSGGYYYNSGIIATAIPSTIDIKALDGNHLATATGYFRVELYVSNLCTGSWYIGLIRNNTITSAYSNFKINDGGGSSFSPNQVLPGTNTSAYGTSLSGNVSTGYVATYQIKVDQVNCSTGAVITSNIVNTPATNVTNGDPSTISAVSLNSKSSPLGYFSSHAGCYKVTYTVANACGSNSQYGYFNSDYTVWRLGENSSNSSDFAYPNPTKGLVTMMFSANEAQTISVKLSNLQGGETYVVTESQAVNAGENYLSFDTSLLPAGVYLYQLNNRIDTIKSGKLVVTK